MPLHQGPCPSSARLTSPKAAAPSCPRAESSAKAEMEGAGMSAGETPLLDLRSLNDGNSSCLTLLSAGT